MGYYMEKLLLVLVVIVGMLYSGQSDAGSARCEGCTLSEFRQQARQMGLGKHIITSYSTNQIRGYEVKYDDEPGVHILRVMHWDVPPVYTQAFIEAHDFYLVTNGTFSTVVEVDAIDLNVPGINYTTAYDLMQNSNMKGMLGDRLVLQMPGVTDKVERMAAGIAAGLYGYVGLTDATITIVVKMYDGSRVVYKITIGSVTADYQEGMSRTPGGQVIPEENSALYEGTWSGAVESLSGFANYMRGLGADVEDTGFGIYLHSVQCTWKTVDGKETLNCKVKWGTYPLPKIK